MQAWERTATTCPWASIRKDSTNSLLRITLKMKTATLLLPRRKLVSSKAWISCWVKNRRLSPNSANKILNPPEITLLQVKNDNRKRKSTMETKKKLSLWNPALQEMIPAGPHLNRNFRRKKINTKTRKCSGRSRTQAAKFDIQMTLWQMNQLVENRTFLKSKCIQMIQKFIYPCSFPLNTLTFF